MEMSSMTYGSKATRRKEHRLEYLSVNREPCSLTNQSRIHFEMDGKLMTMRLTKAEALKLSAELLQVALKLEV